MLLLMKRWYCSRSTALEENGNSISSQLSEGAREAGGAARGPVVLAPVLAPELSPVLAPAAADAEVPGPAALLAALAARVPGPAAAEVPGPVGGSNGAATWLVLVLVLTPGPAGGPPDAGAADAALLPGRALANQPATRARMAQSRGPGASASASVESSGRGCWERRSSGRNRSRGSEHERPLAATVQAPDPPTMSQRFNRGISHQFAYAYLEFDLQSAEP